VGLACTLDYILTEEEVKLILLLSESFTENATRRKQRWLTCSRSLKKKSVIKWKKNGLKFGITGPKETRSETKEVDPHDNNYVAR
jgi:hypothetical protein